MRSVLVPGVLCVALIGCGEQVPVAPASAPAPAPAPAPVAKNISDAVAKYEAEKLLAALNGKPQTAAFIDQVLADDTMYQSIFIDGLQKVVAATPKDAPAFAPYRVCVEAADALLKFAELRRIAGRQNDQSDQYRQPFWAGLGACKAAVKG